ncbi:hypothetical protein IWX65_000430 [Arthrobacter sp. CAN_A214]
MIPLGGSALPREELSRPGPTSRTSSNDRTRTRMRNEPSVEARTAGGSDAPAGKRPDPGAAADADGIIVLSLPAGEHITQAVAERKAREARKLAGGVARPLLIDISGVLSIDRAARSVMGNASISTAIALLGSSPVDRVIGNFLLGGRQPSCPVEFFSSEGEALAWLSGFRRYPESNER